MKKRIFLMGTFICLLLCCSLANAGTHNFPEASTYDYPFADRYVATILGTPPEFTEGLPEDIPTKVDTIKIFPERQVPDILWNLDELYYSYQRQDGPAPLIFLVAGTGASFKSEKMLDMQRGLLSCGIQRGLAVITNPPEFYYCGFHQPCAREFAGRCCRPLQCYASGVAKA